MTEDIVSATRLILATLETEARYSRRRVSQRKGCNGKADFNRVEQKPCPAVRSIYFRYVDGAECGATTCVRFRRRE